MANEAKKDVSEFQYGIGATPNEVNYIISDGVINNESIKNNGQLTDDEAEQLKSSACNDNGCENPDAGNGGGCNLPLPTPDIETCDGDDATNIDTKTIESQCLELNVNVSNCANAYKSTELVEADTALNFPAIPDDPIQLTTFITASEKAVEAAKILCAKPYLSAQEYLALHNKAKQHGYILLEAALKLSIQINSIETHPGQRNGMYRTKEQILQEDFHLTPAQARRIAMLTVDAVDKEKKRAREQDDIPTISGAVKFAKAARTKLEKAKEKAAKKSENIACDVNTPIALSEIDGKYDIIYADFNKFDENFDISTVANDNALLYLWVENEQLVSAIQAIYAQGFEYNDNSAYVCIKCQRNGKYLSDYHKLVLVAVKGDFPKPEYFKDKSVVYEADVAESGEYAYYKQLIQKAYPDASLLDLTMEEPVENTTENEEDTAVDNTTDASQEVCND